jgi:hypothetical protein
VPYIGPFGLFQNNPPNLSRFHTRLIILALEAVR